MRTLLYINNSVPLGMGQALSFAQATKKTYFGPSFSNNYFETSQLFFPAKLFATPEK